MFAPMVLAAALCVSATGTAPATGPTTRPSLDELTVRAANAHLAASAARVGI